MFRSKTIVACFTAGALALSACGGSDDSSSASPIPESGGEMPEGEPIILGLDEDSTSAGAAYSTRTADAIRATVDKIKGEGGILDRPVELVVGNSESDPTKGSAVARNLIDQGAVGIFLTAGSSASVQMKPVLQSEQVIGIAPTATSAELVTQPDADFVYTVAPSVGAWAPTYCGAFEAAGVETLGVMYEDSPALVALTESLIEDTGDCVDVVAQELARADSTDVTAQATKIDQANPDAILTSTSGGAFEVLIQNTLAQVAQDTPRYTVMALSNQPDQWRVANAGALEGLVGLATIDSSNPRTEEAVEFFRSVNGDDFEVVGFDLQAYDSVYLLKEAIEAAGAADDPAAINEALGATTDYEPHFGLPDFRLSFTAEDHNAAVGDCGVVLAEWGADNALGGPWETFQPSC